MKEIETRRVAVDERRTILVERRFEAEEKERLRKEDSSKLELTERRALISVLGGMVSLPRLKRFASRFSTLKRHKLSMRALHSPLGSIAPFAGGCVAFPPTELVFGGLWQIWVGETHIHF